MDEARLLEKLRALEALFAGAATDGERDAAGYVLTAALTSYAISELTS